MLMDADTLRGRFDQGVDYASLVALGEPEGHRPPWDQRYAQLTLTNQQDALIKSFAREMNVLCMTGTWCGDCALQGSAMARIAQANPDRIHLRFIPRSEDHAPLITKAQINAGFRVPVTWFMAEDFEPVAVFGDRTLSRYRAMARTQLPDGGATVVAEPPADPVRAVLDEVLDEFERVHILLRLSARLRQKHGD